jgi:hypothetical protein
MKKIIFLILSLFVPLIICGQSLDTLRGLIKDSTGNPIPGANIWVYSATDTLHSMSNEYGQVKFSFSISGNISVRVTSLAYEEGKMSIIGGQKYFELVLREKMNMLKEVVVRGDVKPVIAKKDTVEYDVSQFIHSQNDVIQDLLARLPGLQVNPDGLVSMMGQRVAKIRINGQEFLVEDIRTLTSIIPANLINKIQLIDDYGEESRLTGRRSRQGEKVINLTTGSKFSEFYAGRLSAAGGTGNLHLLYGNAFKYSDKQSIGLLVSNNNIGNTAGKANNTEGGLVYRTQINKKFSVNTGINYKNTSNNTELKSQSEAITSEGALNNSSNSNSNNKDQSLTPKAEITYDPDGKNHLSFNLSGSFRKAENLIYTSNLQTGFQRKDQATNSNSLNQSNQLESGISFSHKYKKPGRVLIWNFDFKSLNNSSNQDLIDSLRYYSSNDNSYYDSSLHQLILADFKNTEIKSRFSFVEPLKETISLEILYNFFDSRSSNSRSTSWMNTVGNFFIIDSLSNRYKFELIQHNLDLNYLHRSKKLDLTFGASIRPYYLIGSRVSKGVSLFPIFQLGYNFNSFSSLNVNFSGENIFPSFQQLTEVPDYSNLQNPIYGNPNLKAAWKQGISLDYIWTKDKSRVFFRLQGNVIQNNIVSNIYLIEDAYGSQKQETHFANINGNYSIESMIVLNNTFKNNSTWVEVQVGGNYSHNVILYNDLKKLSNSLGINNKISLNYKRGILDASPSLIYNISKNTFSIYDDRAIVTQFLNFGLYNNLNFPKNFTIENRLSKSLNMGFGSAVGNNPFIFDMNIIRRWLNRKLITLLEFHNLFNETTSFSQGVSNNTISATSSATLGRYFLIRVIFDLKVL